ncbi:MAG: signal peptidase I [SAR324 cluster bacterium]|nr:signal peptidase I [SAR324 cluster bacterium]
MKRLIKNKTIREWIEAILFAFIAAFIIRTWFYAPFRVPTGSMIPTIEVGDQIIADMNVYGLHIPFTKKRVWEGDIKRGDIVIFPNPANPEICNSSFYGGWDTISALFIGFFVDSNYVPKCVDYIKRVVALEENTIEIIGEKVYINGLPESGYQTYFNTLLPPRNIFYKEKVPKGMLFVMGDNRRDSHDGRFWRINGARLSYVSMDNIRARGKLIYFSLDPSLGVMNGGIRWDRIFSILR